MSYPKDTQYENDQFPTILSKEDTRELLSIIETINSNEDQKNKIGLNLQFRQLRIPEKILQSLIDRKNEVKNLKTKDKEIIEKILNIYDDNKNNVEIYEREKNFDIERMDKEIKQYNMEESELDSEIEKTIKKIKDVKDNTNEIRYENDNRNKYIMKNEIEVKTMEENIDILNKEYDAKLNKSEAWKELKNYIKNKEKINTEEKAVKNLFCVICKREKRKIYYLGCQHLALCKKCYSENKKYEKKCPICSKISELVVRLDEIKKSY